MLQKLSKQIVSWQIDRRILTPEKRALYEYAYEAMFHQILNIAIACIIAVWQHAFAAAAVFLVSYIPMRSYGGGYHAKTNMRCTVMSSILIFLVCWGERRIPDGMTMPMLLTAFGISGLLLLLCAPIEDRNKPLDDQERAHYRQWGGRIWLIEAFAGLVFCVCHMRAGITLALSHLIFSLMLCAGIWKYRVQETAGTVI